MRQSNSRKARATLASRLRHFYNSGQIMCYLLLVMMLSNGATTMASDGEQTAGITAELYPLDVRQRPTAERFYIFDPADTDFDNDYTWYGSPAQVELHAYDWQHKRRAHNILEQLLDRINEEIGRRRPETTSQR